MIVKKEDFTGLYKVSQSKYTNMDEYIERFEKYYLLRLMGSDLYDLFKADLTGDPEVPQAARFISLFDPFNLDDGNCMRESEGIKKMLIQFIYFHYTRDTYHTHTVGGHVRDNQTATNNLVYEANLEEAYNKGVRNFREIQWYIDDSFADYPEENMQYIGFISGI